MRLSVRTFRKEDFLKVLAIYQEGIDTGIATFETDIPDWNTWDKKYIDTCRIVATLDERLVGYSVLSKVSNRKAYKGVAEVSVYVSANVHRKGVGALLLKRLITESEKHGFWTLQASIFTENIASIKLHEQCGFRHVGVRERIAKLHGNWYDNLLLERRIKQI